MVFTISYLFSPESAYLLSGLALLLAFFGSFFSYYYSDQILLKMANAHPVNPNEDHYLHHTIEGVAIAAGLPVPKAYIIETDIPMPLLPAGILKCGYRRHPRTFTNYESRRTRRCSSS